MAQYMSDVTALSSKGQIVLPKAIRDYLKITSGAKLMVFSDGDSILLKPIPVPDISEFRALMDKAAEWADGVGMQEEDIAEAIKTVRSRTKK
ncbi:MAG: AbrB/MazE/SpoVT family DNA-binding domain-containing protein [Lachnospiraceae bacterium]|nr:AbrB/MazE/SpoVT family DNA-binding domain-containing protein [Lachnospiraceae bacterium]